MKTLELDGVLYTIYPLSPEKNAYLMEIGELSKQLGNSRDSEERKKITGELRELEDVVLGVGVHPFPQEERHRGELFDAIIIHTNEKNTELANPRFFREGAPDKDSRGGRSKTQ